MVVVERRPIRAGGHPVTATDAAMAMTCGVFVYAALVLRHRWPLAAGALSGVATQNPYVLIAGLMVGTAFSQYLDVMDYADGRDRDQQAALLFVVRLGQILTVRGSLAAALDEMGYRSSRVGSDAAERVLSRVAQDLRVEPLTFLTRAVAVVRRHGGSLSPVLDWARDAIQEAQGVRYARQLEEAVQRSTMVVLALAPWGVALLFRVFIPGFYQSLMTTRLGSIAVLAIGMTTYGVFWVMIRHMREEAWVR